MRRHHHKRRLAFAAGAITILASAATLTGGVTFGLFSATESSGSNSLTSGTVTVGTGSPSSVTCNVSNMVPGDSSSGYGSGSGADTECTYNVKYTGSVSAYLGVDIGISNGSPALFDATSTGLQLLIKDGSPNTYATGVDYYNQSNTATALPTSGISDLLVSTTPATTNTAVSFTIDYLLPTTAGNSYQGASTAITLTFHAVQSSNNAVPSGCHGGGQQCVASGSFAWS
jgi:hypothetical protein